MSLLVYPNQLFEKKYIPKNIHTIVLYEHPDFFTKYNFNKLKLLLHRASMKEYAKHMAKYFKIIYIDFNRKLNLPKSDLFMFFQPNNMKTHGQCIPSPNFLCHDLFEKYRTKTDKFVFNNFYIWMKRELNIIPNIKSQDKQNRNKIPAGRIAQIPDDKYFASGLAEPMAYINKHFGANVGPTEMSAALFPINRTQAKALLRYFVKNKLSDYGRYQDAIVFGGPNCLYHSCISSALNIGLINPLELIQAVKSGPVNSAEAFIRQLFWREYQLYCYTYISWPACKPFYKVRRRLAQDWYTGATGIDPVDIAIKKAFQCGYLHHIERLMVVGNYMLLSGMHPRDGFKWFMEFSIDSYEWVMMQNVLDMVFSMSGLTMSRIYISSSNYIVKMSNAGASENWRDAWDAAYHLFLKNNKNKIGYPYE